MYGKVFQFAKGGSLSLRTTESISACAFSWTSGKSIMTISVEKRYRGMESDEDLEGADDFDHQIDRKTTRDAAAPLAIAACNIHHGEQNQS
jgi:hypothetical protein